MNKAILEQYAELKRIEKEIGQKISELAPQIIELMGENQEVETDFGLFCIGRRRKWRYPDEVQEVELKLKQLKKEAEQIGTADYEESSYLLFRTDNGQEI